MTEKSLINSVDNCVDECLYGFSKTHPHLEVHYAQKIVIDPGSYNNRKVAVISGGGSGHEPFPAGYVGNGMLTASVSGPVFTSPPSNHILYAIRLAAAESEGVLLVVPNYTGDVLNFGLAAEIAISEGVLVESLVVGEDIAQEAYSITNKTGRRGMCGLVLILKIAGYFSQIGENLTTVKELSNDALQSMASMGLCVSSCSKPGIGLLFHLSEDEMELGVGVHGEAGVARFKLLSAQEAVKLLLELLIQYLKLTEGDEVAVLVNNLGSLSYIEQWLLAGEVEKQLREENIIVLRLYAGCFFTSLNMAGVQVCLLKLQQNNKKVFLEALDYQTSASAWPNKVEATTRSCGKVTQRPSSTLPGSSLLSPNEAVILEECLIRISDDLKKEERYLNYLDSACGDGDCGSTFSRIASEILLKTKSSDFANPAGVFSQLSLSMQESIGGTSGALYGLFFKGISNELEKYTSFDEVFIIPKCWRAGIDGIKKYSRARLGDRTMLDSLETGCETLEKRIAADPENFLEAFRDAVKASETACQSTRTMKAAAGRASYTDQSQQKNVDAGAYAVTIWLSAILHVLDTL